jgi:DNA-binding response OmpR family regulator
MKKKILVIEDDDYSRDALAHILESEGYEMEFAGEANDGYECALEMQPDVIILDMRLPGMDGKQFIEMMRADDALKAIPILVVTGNYLEGKAAIEMGASGCFVKPVDFSELIRAVSELSRGAVKEQTGGQRS